MTYQWCAKCGSKYPTSKGDLPIVCFQCKTQPTKFILKVWWLKKTVSISYDRDGRTLNYFGQAMNLLGSIRSEIQSKTFDPEIYKRHSNTRFITFWETFQDKYKDRPGSYGTRNSSDEAVFSTSLLKLWLYGSKRAARKMDTAVSIFHHAEEGKDVTKALQEAIVEMRKDIQVWPWQRIKPSEVRHLYTKIVNDNEATLSALKEKGKRNKPQ